MDKYAKFMETISDEAFAKSLQGLSEEDAIKALSDKGVDVNELEAPEAELTPEQMDEVSGGAKIYCRFCQTTYKNEVTYWLHVAWSSACMSQIASNKKSQGIK